VGLLSCLSLVVVALIFVSACVLHVELNGDEDEGKFQWFNP
jgi:hypothetical protein